MKRHLVMDLYFGDQIEEAHEEWREGNPNIDKCKVKVKLSEGGECFAYFYSDMASFCAKIGIKPSYYWHSNTHEPLYDVTHYKILKKVE